MAKEEAQAGAEEGKGQDKQKKGGKLIPLLLIVNLLLVAGLGAFIFLGGGHKTEKDGEASSDAADEAAAKEKGGTADIGPIVELDPFLVNLDESGQARYLKITIQFEMSGPEVSDEVKARVVPVRDLIITYLSSLNFSQTQGQVNKEIIRTALLKRINASLTKGEVKNIYFTDFVIQ